MESFENLFEKLVRKVLFRKGKRIRKKKTDRKGYKSVGGKEVRMSAKEKRNRKLSQRRGARKRKATKAGALRKRKLTMRKRRLVSK